MNEPREPNGDAAERSAEPLQVEEIDLVHDLVELVMMLLAEAGEEGLLGSTLIGTAQVRGLEAAPGRALEESAIVYAAGIACGIGLAEVVGFNPSEPLFEQRLRRV